MYINNNAPVNI